MFRKIFKRGKLAWKVLRYGPNDTSIRFRPYVLELDGTSPLFKFIVPDIESKNWYDIDYGQIPTEIKMLSALTRPSDHVLEIGVHNGFYAAMFSRILSSQYGRYHGVELMPECYLNSLANLKLNNAGSNCQIIHAAAGDKVGRVHYADILSGNGMIDNSGKGLPIDQLTGDSLLPFFEGKVDLLKIDVEGYEKFVLYGCRQILSQNPNIALELHLASWSSFDTKLENILSLIDLNQYQSFFFCNTNSGRISMLDEPERIRNFDPLNMPNVDNMNLFLFSKKHFPNSIQF